MLINPKKMASFARKVLAVMLPVLSAVIILGALAELFLRPEYLPPVDATWKLGLTLAAAFLPGIVAVTAAYQLAIRFVRDLHGLENLGEAGDFLQRCLFGQRGPGPGIRITGAKASVGQDNVLMKVGGPGGLLVYHDNMALLEQSGRLTRIAGKGPTTLAPLERVYDIVDLRPFHAVEAISAMSKEGIPVTCEAEISFQIDNEGVPPTDESPYPASDDVVFRAATSTWIREDHRAEGQQTMNWAQRLVNGEATGNLRAILARYPLNRLIGLSDLSGGNAREEVRQQLEAALRVSAPKLGARILNVELGDIVVRDAITQQWAEAWKADWLRWATEREGLGKARQTAQLESAKTRAQVMLLSTITEALQPLLVDDTNITSQLVLTRLFMVLSRSPSDPLTRVNLPKEAIGTLKLIKELVS